MNALALRIEDVRPVSGEPRVRDTRLGEVLGFAKPVSIRKIIRRNERELAMHGDIFSTVEKFSGQQSGPAAKEYHLNEAQALLVCMFSRTNQAVEARKQIVTVFLSYRAGKLVPAQKAPSRHRPAAERDVAWEAMEKRIKRLEKLMQMQDRVETRAFASAVAYAPSILYLDQANGKRKKQRRPRWWYDREVREAVIATHRQMTIDIAAETLKNQFGKGRAPTRSSIGRFWMVLDEVRAAV